MGCHEQEHVVNWAKLSNTDKASLDFLRLPEIAPQVFMTDSLDSYAKKGQPQSFVGLVQEFKRHVISSLRKQ